MSGLRLLVYLRQFIPVLCVFLPQNTLLGHLLGEEAVMSPFSMLGRGLGGLPLMAPLEERIESTFRCG